MQDQPNWFRQFDAPTRYTPEQLERERQARSEATERAIEARQAREAALVEQRERERLERAAGELDAYKAERRIKWIAATGSEDGFLAAWPAMRERYVAERGSMKEQLMAELRATGNYD